MPSGHSAADIYIIGGRFDLLTGHWRLDQRGVLMETSGKIR